MPARQYGKVVKRGPKNFQARYRDEEGKQRGRSGFRTATEARDWLNAKLVEVEALRRGELPAVRRRNPPTLAELVDEYLGQHNAQKNTLKGLRDRLKYATEGPKLDGQGGFGELRVDRLDPSAIGAWRRGLPERSAWGIHKAFRQALGYAVRIKLLDENVAKAVPNPEPKRREVLTFETLDLLEKIGEELSAPHRGLPIFVALTGLRPEEWIALQRRDVDRAAGVVHVRRVFTAGEPKLVGKNTRSLRAVPLPARALAALDDFVGQSDDTRLLFPAHRGGHLHLDTWRNREWTPALKAAGIPHRQPYSLRHTYATWSIAAGVELYELARFMGTSVKQIDDTYGHLMPNAIERTRARLDEFVRLFPERSLDAEAAK